MDFINKSENINLLWTNLIIEELIRHKVDYFCISPGSRSTPLTIAAVKHPKTKTKIIYDERGAAFHALGYARATKTPAVLICTSGTAVANYYPAVIEAYQENIPLIVLSADRPLELRNTGANQTIDQVDIFGKYTHHFVDLPCPSIDIEPGFVLSEIDKAVFLATAVNAGPVQINCMFREPLAPQKEVWPNNYLAAIKEWLSCTKIFTKKEAKKSSAPEEEINSLIEIINKNPRGFIIAGRMENPDDQRAVLMLAEKIKWPIFADITSVLRLNSKSTWILHFFDRLLLSDGIESMLTRIPILHFGGQFVSKRLLQLLKIHKGEHIHVSATDKIIDPANSVTKKLNIPICALIEKILPRLEKRTESHLNLEKYHHQVHEIIGQYSEHPQDTLSEISVAQIISQNITNEAALFIASSMPIRDMDMFAIPNQNDVIIGSNRGASGIDGTIASSLGFASGLRRPLTLLIGDLAFMHDLNALAMIKDCAQPIIIVLINNQGGGIFSFLPVADYEDVFERNFATSHNFTFEKIAEMFGLKYFNPKSNQDFITLYTQYQYSKKPTLIEIRTNRTENFQQHKELNNKIISVLATK